MLDDPEVRYRFFREPFGEHWMVFADWLEARGDPRADHVRWHQRVHLRRSPADHNATCEAYEAWKQRFPAPPRPPDPEGVERSYLRGFLSRVAVDLRYVDLEALQALRLQDAPLLFSVTSMRDGRTTTSPV